MGLMGEIGSKVLGAIQPRRVVSEAVSRDVAHAAQIQTADHLALNASRYAQDPLHRLAMTETEAMEALSKAVVKRENSHLLQEVSLPAVNYNIRGARVLPNDLSSLPQLADRDFNRMLEKIRSSWDEGQFQELLLRTTNPAQARRVGEAAKQFHQVSADNAGYMWTHARLRAARLENPSVIFPEHY